MKKAFKSEGILCLFSHENRCTNDKTYCCYYHCIHHYLNNLFNKMKGTHGLLQEIFCITGAKTNEILRLSTGAYSLNRAGVIQQNTGKKNACPGLNTENTHPISYKIINYCL